MVDASAGIPALLIEELRALQEQENVTEWKPFALNIESYRVLEHQLVVRLNVVDKWPSFRNDSLPIPAVFDFEEIWRDKHGNKFEGDVVRGRTLRPDGREALELDWGKIVRQSENVEGKSAVCYLVLTLPQNKEKLKKRLSPSGGVRFEVDKNIDKIYNFVDVIDWGGDAPDDLDDLPDPNELTYDVGDQRTFPSKLEHVEKQTYRLNIEDEEFEKDTTTKTYVEIEDIDVSSTSNLQREYEG